MHQELLILTYTCPLKWEDMEGDDKQRHCSKCLLNVQNISRLSAAHVEEIFEKARGEQVCIKSEGSSRLASYLAPQKHVFRFGAAAAAAISILAAWLVGFFKAPATARDADEPSKSRKSLASTVYKFADNRSASLATLANVERFGFGVVPQKSQTVWPSIVSLKCSSTYSVNVPQRVTSLRKSIITRAENDKTVVTEDLLRLSKMYRAEGFNQAADNCLGIAITILDLVNPPPPFSLAPSSSRLTSARIGEVGAGSIQDFHFSEMKHFELDQFRRCLSNYEEKLKQGQDEWAGQFLLAAVGVAWRNPLLYSDYGEAKLDKKIEDLIPRITTELSSTLSSAHSRLNERLTDLGEYI